jgi:hypothetical protein
MAEEMNFLEEEKVDTPVGGRRRRRSRSRRSKRRRSKSRRSRRTRRHRH